MPRQKPMSPEERAICDRLKAFRCFLGLSQAEFAALAGLNPLAYASYEYHKSQLNYPAAWRILTTFRQLNPRWLAGDHGQMLDVHFVPYPSPEELPFGPRTAFSVVYEWELKGRLLSGKIAWLTSPDKSFPQFRFTPDAPGKLAARETFGLILLNWLTILPDDRMNIFLDELLLAAAALLKKYPAGDDAKASEQKWKELLQLQAKYAVGNMLAADVEKNMLTDTATHDKTVGVKSEWFKLQKKIQAATAEAGGKSKLAEFLRVDLTQLSKWLTDSDSAREPGADYTLKMLAWVNNPKRQK